MFLCETSHQLDNKDYNLNILLTILIHKNFDIEAKIVKKYTSDIKY